MSAKKKKSSKEPFTMNLRVLGRKDGDEPWSAHCLETDLVGYGNTFEDALDNLSELTEMQVSFAFQMDQLSLLDHPAPPEIHEIYAVLNRASMNQFFSNSEVDDKRRIHNLPISRPDRKFSPCFVPS